MLEKTLAAILTVMVSEGMSKTTPTPIEPLRNWRKSEKLSTKAAGLLVGVSGVQWHRYESGHRAIPLDRLLPIAKLTGLEIKQLSPSVAEQLQNMQAAQ